MEGMRGAWRKLLALDESPHKIALGVALGTIVAYQPIVGIQMVVGAFVCRLFGASIPASVPMAWITNPLTIVPVYYATYQVGIVFTGGEMTYADIQRIMDQIEALGFLGGITEGWRVLKGIYWPLIVGGAVVGFINGGIFYVLVSWLIKRYRSRRSRA